MVNKEKLIEKFLKYFTIFSWGLAVFTLELFIVSIKTHGNFSLWNFINDELTFILVPLIFRWLYLISKEIYK
jgi:hypothetical protein